MPPKKEAKVIPGQQQLVFSSQNVSLQSLPESQASSSSTSLTKSTSCAHKRGEVLFVATVWRNTLEVTIPMAVRKRWGILCLLYFV